MNATHSRHSLSSSSSFSNSASDREIIPLQIIEEKKKGKPCLVKKTIGLGLKITDNSLNFLVPNNKLQSSVKGPLVSFCLNCVRKWQIKNKIFFMTRFAMFSEKSNENMSLTLAINAFWNAYKQDPAYNDFINKSLGDVGKIAKFSDIPVTTKENYLRQYPLKETLKYGKMPVAGQIDTSTGTTGNPTKWVHGPAERGTIKTMIHNIVDVAMKGKPFIFINAFAPGPWSTAMQLAAALVDKALSFTAGPDTGKILEFLTDPNFSGLNRPYIIASYPPFLKKLVVAAKEKNIDLSQYDMLGVVGGEGMSVNLRERIIEGGFKEVLSSYGASDLSIFIGSETKFEIELRKECERNPALAAELYGENCPVPMIFHYDPFNYFIWSDEENNLIFTCVRDDPLQHKINYKLGDKGFPKKVSLVNKILKKHGVVLKDREGNEVTNRTNLPLLFVWGRAGTAVSYNGSKLVPQNLEDALSKLPEITVENYGFSAYEDTEANNRLQILVEVGAKQSVDEFDYKKLSSDVLTALAEGNGDFRFQLEKATQENLHLPELILFPYNTGPMANQDPHRKKQYIYDKQFRNVGEKEEAISII